MKHFVTRREAVDGLTDMGIIIHPICYQYSEPEAGNPARIYWFTYDALVNLYTAEKADAETANK